eukprot:8793173-Prorocentrum_lima.AAC.1
MGVCSGTLWLDMGVEILIFPVPGPLASSSPLPSIPKGTLFRVSPLPPYKPIEDSDHSKGTLFRVCPLPPHKPFEDSDHSTLSLT